LSSIGEVNVILVININENLFRSLIHFSGETPKIMYHFKAIIVKVNKQCFVEFDYQDQHRKEKKRLFRIMLNCTGSGHL